MDSAELGEKTFREQPDLCLEWQGELATKVSRIGSVKVSSSTRADFKPKMKDLIGNKIELLQLPMTTVLKSVLEQHTLLRWTQTTRLSEEGRIRLLYIRVDKPDTDRWQKAMTKLSAKEIVPFCMVGDGKYFLVISFPLAQKYFSRCLLGSFNDNRMAYGILVTGKALEITVKESPTVPKAQPGLVRQESTPLSPTVVPDVNGNSVCKQSDVAPLRRLSQSSVKTDKEKEDAGTKSISDTMPSIAKIAACLPNNNNATVTKDNPVDSAIPLLSPESVASPKSWFLKPIITDSEDAKPVTPPTGTRPPTSTALHCTKDHDERKKSNECSCQLADADESIAVVSKTTKEKRIVTISKLVNEELKKIRAQETPDQIFTKDTDLRVEMNMHRHKILPPREIDGESFNKESHMISDENRVKIHPGSSASVEDTKHFENFTAVISKVDDCPSNSNTEKSTKQRRERQPIELEEANSWTEKKHAIVRPSKIERRRSKSQTSELAALELEAAVTAIHSQDKSRSKEKGKIEEEDVVEKPYEKDGIKYPEDMFIFTQFKHEMSLKWELLEKEHDNAPYVRTKLASAIGKVFALKEKFKKEEIQYTKSWEEKSKYFAPMYAELGKEAIALHSALCTAKNLKSKSALECTEKWVSRVNRQFYDSIQKSCDILTNCRKYCPNQRMELFDKICKDVYKFRDYLDNYESIYAEYVARSNSKDRSRDGGNTEEEDRHWKRSLNPESFRDRSPSESRRSRRRSRDSRRSYQSCSGSRSSERYRSSSSKRSSDSPRRKSSNSRSPTKRRRFHSTEKREFERHTGYSTEREHGKYKRSRSRSFSPEIKKRKSSHSWEETDENNEKPVPKQASPERKIVTEIDEGEESNHNAEDSKPSHHREKLERTYRKNIVVESEDSVESGEFVESFVDKPKPKSENESVKRSLLAPGMVCLRQSKKKKKTKSKEKDKEDIVKVKSKSSSRLGAKLKNLACIMKRLSPTENIEKRSCKPKENTEDLKEPTAEKSFVKQLLDRANQKKAKRKNKIMLNEGRNEARDVASDTQNADLDSQVTASESQDSDLEKVSSPLVQLEPTCSRSADDSVTVTEPKIPAIDIVMLQEVVNSDVPDTSSLESDTEVRNMELSPHPIETIQNTGSKTSPQVTNCTNISQSYTQAATTYSSYAAPYQAYTQPSWYAGQPAFWYPSNWPQGYYGYPQYQGQNVDVGQYWSKNTFPSKPNPGSYRSGSLFKPKSKSLKTPDNWKKFVRKTLKRDVSRTSVSKNEIQSGRVPKTADLCFKLLEKEQNEKELLKEEADPPQI